MIEEFLGIRFVQVEGVSTRDDFREGEVTVLGVGGGVGGGGGGVGWLGQRGRRVRAEGVSTSNDPLRRCKGVKV